MANKQKIFVLVIIVLFFFTAGCFNNESPLPSPTPQINIWFIPHPDDDALFMGSSIYKSENNIVILLSHGENSSVKHKLNITAEELALRRLGEFEKAMQILNILPQNIYSYNLTDGNFSFSGVFNIAVSFVNKYPEAIFHTMTYYDSHNDHATTGSVLKYFLEEERIKECKFYVANYDYGKIAEVYENNLSINAILAKRKMLEVYEIGRLSVPDLWLMQYEEHCEVYHY
jgi:LmbE family N-acetylglucosaminyl deacetylase